MKKILNLVVFSAIILSIVYFFLNECSRIFHPAVFWKNIILISGFFLDIIFTIDFAVRSIHSRKRQGIEYYIKYERGWADLISSLLPLIIDSAPSLFLVLSDYSGTAAAHSFFIMLKPTGVAETFRFFRIIKIFNMLKTGGSEMAGHHISAINTLAISSILAVYLIFSPATGNSQIGLLKKLSDDYVSLVDGLKRISDMNDISYREVSESMLVSDKNILRIIYANGTVVEKVPDPEFRKRYGRDDFIQVTGKACTVFVSSRDINRIQAVSNIQVLMIIIVTITVFMFIYSRHFTRNISDILHILNQGFRKRDYNLLVKIPDKYRNHEIFRLSKFYNDAYLPAKMKKIMSQDSSGKTIR